MQTIVLPEVEQVFSEDGVSGNINTLGLYRFSDHYQKQIKQLKTIQLQIVNCLFFNKFLLILSLLNHWNTL